MPQSTHAQRLRRLYALLKELGDGGPKALKGLAMLVGLLLLIGGCVTLDFAALLEGELKFRTVQRAAQADPWKELLGLAEGAEGPVILRAPRTGYLHGEVLTLTVEVDTPGHLHVLSLVRGSTEITTFFPNPDQPGSRVEPGQAIEIPPVGASFTLTAGLPDGVAEQTILVVALLTPHDLHLYRDRPQAPAIFHRLTGDELSRGFRETPRLRAGKLLLTIRR